MDKRTVYSIVAIVVAIIIIWLLHRRVAAASVAQQVPATSTPPGLPLISFLSNIDPGLGIPVSYPLVYGQRGQVMQPITYEIPTPSFAYGGNQSIYMPLFGFVGYSQYATVP